MGEKRILRTTADVLLSLFSACFGAYLAFGRFNDHQDKNKLYFAFIKDEYFIRSATPRQWAASEQSIVYIVSIFCRFIAPTLLLLVDQRNKNIEREA